MRLGQIARKYEVPVQEIISYLEDIKAPSESLHPNSKFDDDDLESLAKHFDFELDVEEVQEEIEEVNEETTEAPEQMATEPVLDTTEEAEPEIAEETEPEPVTTEPRKEPETALDDIAMVEGEIEFISGKDASPEKVLEKENEPQPLEKEILKEDEVIETDRLLELLEAEEEPVDLEKIKLIKAPKKELSGLKVLGKIEMPEPKKKKEEEVEPEEKRPKLDPETLRKRQEAREGHREKKRLLVKKKEEERQEQQEKRRKEREKKELTAKKAAHYQQKLARAQAKSEKNKTPAPPEPIMPEIEQPPEPKTFLARLWRWLSTGSDW